MRNDWNKPKMTNTHHYKAKEGMFEQVDGQVRPSMPTNSVSGAGRSNHIPGHKRNGPTYADMCISGPRSGVNPANKKG